MKYSNGFRARMVQRMVGPEGIGAIKLAEGIGVHQTTLSRWLREASGEEKKALESQHTQLEPDQGGGPEPKSDAARPNRIRFFRATTTLTFSGYLLSSLLDIPT